MLRTHSLNIFGGSGRTRDVAANDVVSNSLVERSGGGCREVVLFGGGSGGSGGGGGGGFAGGGGGSGRSQRDRDVAPARPVQNLQ